MAELNNTSTGKWSETDASNTSPSPDGWPSGTFPNQVEPIGRSTMGAIKRFWDRLNGITPVSGTANAIILTPSNTSYPTAYVQGEIYQFTAIAANTGATTININGLGTKNIYKKGTTGSVALTGGEINVGDNVMLSYDGAQMQILSSLPITTTGLAPIVSPNFTTSASLNSNPLFDNIIVRYIATSTTYSPSAGLVKATFEGLGGGGGGGGTQSSGGACSGGGGGAGARSVVTLSASAIGSSQSIIIGAGGNGGYGAVGLAGNTTSVGTFLTAPGGSPGGVGINTGAGTAGLGGTPGTGDITVNGMPGHNGNAYNSGIISLSGANGGASNYSGGGLGGFSSSGYSNGGGAGGYGGGGGASVSFNSGVGTGGNGSQGIVIVTEYISA